MPRSTHSFKRFTLQSPRTSEIGRSARSLRAAFSFCMLLCLLMVGCRSGDGSTDAESATDGSASSTVEQSTNVLSTATWSLAKGWQIPLGVPTNATQDDWNELGWQTFIALSWPAQWSNWPAPSTGGASGGEPDTGASITTAPTPYSAVWQTYLAPEQVFLANGADPGTWDTPTNTVETQVDPSTGATLLVLGGFSKGATSAESSDEFNEATDNPLIDQNNNYVNFEIRMNQAEFTYIMNNQFYDAANQTAATANDNAIPAIPKTGQERGLNLPSWAEQGALEIKSSWRILTDPTFDDRYFTMRAFRELPNGSVDGPHTFGLVGLHILRLTPTSGSTWYWATFEQVDNVRIDQSPVPTGLTPSFNPGTSAPYPTYTSGWEYNGQSTTPPPAIANSLPVSNPVNTSFIDGAIQSGAAALNSTFQSQLQGTVWQYYQMVGVMNPWISGESYDVPPFNNSTNSNQMVNTTMETFSQGTASAPKDCLSCHAFATPIGATKIDGYPKNPGNQIFTFLLGNAQSSAAD